MKKYNFYYAVPSLTFEMNHFCGCLLFRGNSHCTWQLHAELFSLFDSRDNNRMEHDQELAVCGLCEYLCFEILAETLIAGLVGARD